MVSDAISVHLIYVCPREFDGGMYGVFSAPEPCSNYHVVRVVTEASVVASIVQMSIIVYQQTHCPQLQPMSCDRRSLVIYALTQATIGYVSVSLDLFMSYQRFNILRQATSDEPDRPVGSTILSVCSFLWVRRLISQSVP